MVEAVNGGRKPSVDCVLIYIWCTNKVTDVIEYKDVKYGRVLSGKAVSLGTIAANLGISWSSAQNNMQHLVDVGLIHRTRGSAMKEYGSSVLFNCRKKFNAKQPDGSAVLKGKRYTRIHRLNLRLRRNRPRLLTSRTTMMSFSLTSLSALTTRQNLNSSM